MTAEEWMTEEYVPFEATLSFNPPQTETGTLILSKDNPSGLPEHDDELRIPVRFAPVQVATERTVQLYYYNPSLDEDANGNILCSEAGLVAVERTIPLTQTPVQDAIHLLLRGEITAQEAARGITTEYPLDGFSLTGAAGANGVLTLKFDDQNNSTSSGSCRAGILWLQIQKTALQFDGVDEVRFQPEELFQP
jgi:spore germination protein GerM